MKKIYALILLVFSVQAIAQQRAQFSQYMVNPYVLNPAVAGTEPYFDLTVGFRKQWALMEASPTTFYADFNMPIGRELGPSHNHHKGEHKGWHAVGGYAYGDITGPTSRNGAMVSYGYNLPVTKHVRLSIGMFAGMQQFKLEDNFVLYDQVDVVLNGEKTELLPDGMIGMWLYSKDFFVGYSSHQVFQSQINILKNTEIESDQDPGRLNLHHFATAGANLHLNYRWDVVPSIMVKHVTPAPVSVDLSCMFREKDGKYFAGASYRGLDSFVAIAGVLVKNQYRISYSLDLTHTELRNYNAGTHEIVINYRWPPQSQVICPANFWK